MAARLRTYLHEHGLLLAALVATLLVYTRVVFYGHISWDDPEMVFANPDVHAFAFGRFFTDHYVGNYIPVTMVAHGIVWALVSENELLHHLLSVCLHLLNGVLVYHFTIRLFRGKPLAAVTTCIFLLHPLQVESVAWIAELKTVLFSAFFLGALICYTISLTERSAKYYLSSLLLFILSCLSKPSAVVFPLAMVCVELALGQPVLRLWKKKLPFFLIAVATGLVTLYTQGEDRFINYAHAFPAAERIGYAGFAILSYWRLFLAPVGLSVIYPYPEGAWPVFAAGYATLGICAFLLVRWFGRKNRLPAMLLFVIFNLALVLQFVPFGEVLFADRYIYIAIIGMGWLVAAALQKTAIDYRYTAVTVMVLLSVFTFGRTLKWKNALTLYEDILSKYPDNFVALNSAGVECMRLGNDRKALDYFSKATETAPRNYKGHYNMGLLFLKMQKPDQAIEKFNQSITLYDYDKAYTGRATAYLLLGDYSKAVSDATRALQLEPENAKAWYVMGSCYNEMNRLKEAREALNTAIMLSPAEAEFYYKRGIVSGKEQQFRKCEEDLHVALSLRPQLYEAHYWLGVALVNLGKDPCADFRIAAQHNFAPAVNAYNKMCR